MENASVLPASIADVWTAVSGFFTTGLSAAITLITGTAILCAPLVVWIAGKVLGQAKGLLKIGGSRRR